NAGATKTFTHPVHHPWLDAVPTDARILDYGCGYGRTMAELSDRGFTDLTGADPSAALLTRGRQAKPDFRFSLLDHPPFLPYAGSSFDVVLLFAVLTCVPADKDQQALIAELHRVLAPGGLLYVSDVLLQNDDRNRARYGAASQTPYGVFATDDGAVCRHHDLTALRALLCSSTSHPADAGAGAGAGGFELVDERHIEVATMNGRWVSGVQLLARRPEGAAPLP
ncbi:class I SAM-dependent methyltransferase, partial [Winogradskya humida]|uniref:class I SAM-dependent methyltransferase n=1 Tax=Winogradskya humida TaxID=113566 RepID=UPI001944E7D1